MNIFFLHECPKRAGTDLIDAHVRKMLVENCQMLANCYEERQLFRDAPRTRAGTPHKHSYVHHPCSKWVMESNLHFDWLLQNSVAIEQQYRKRFQKLHFSRDFLLWCYENKPNLPGGFLNDPPLCMPKKYQIYDGVVECYREFYRKEKRFTKSGKPMFFWTNMETPTWISEPPVMPQPKPQPQPEALDYSV